jgi:hypothetical protein
MLAVGLFQLGERSLNYQPAAGFCISAFSGNAGEYFAVSQLLRLALHVPWLAEALESLVNGTECAEA